MTIATRTLLNQRHIARALHCVQFEQVLGCDVTHIRIVVVKGLQALSQLKWMIRCYENKE